MSTPEDRVNIEKRERDRERAETWMRVISADLKQHFPVEVGPLRNDKDFNLREANAVVGVAFEARLNELKDQLNNKDADTKSIYTSVTDLNNTLQAYRVVHWGLEKVSDFYKSFKGNDVNPEAINSLVGDVIKSATNLREVVDSKEITLGDKLSITLKSYGSAAGHACKEMWEGMTSSFSEGKSLGAIAQTVIEKGLNGFFSKFQSGLKERLEKAVDHKESDQLSMGEPQSSSFGKIASANIEKEPESQKPSEENTEKTTNQPS